MFAVVIAEGKAALAHMALPAAAFFASLVETLDATLKMCQIAFVLASIVYVVYQIWKIRLEIAEKVKRLNPFRGRSPDGGL